MGVRSGIRGAGGASGPTGGARVRHAEIVGALSLATDLGMGLPMGWALRTGVLAARFAEAMRLSPAEAQDAYYLSLLRFMGCTAEADTAADVFGDEITARPWMTAVWSGGMGEMAATFVRNVGAGLPPLARLRQLGATLAGMPRLMQGMVAHCEVAQLLAEQLGFSVGIQRALVQAYERWDGRGGPGRLRGEATVLPMRLVQVVHDVELAHRQGGVAGAVDTLRRHAGAHDPALVEGFCLHAAHLFDGLEEETDWEPALAAEPEPHQWLEPAQLDAALGAMADFTDLKLPAMGGHSRGVSALAAAAARTAKLPEASVTLLARAGLLHDLGRVGVTTAIWGKPRSLTEGERDAVRLHPYYTERILSRPRSLAPIGALAALHHERLDGAGYHRAVPGTMLSPEARLLIAADAYQAMTQARPYRAALAPQAAAEELRRAARAGAVEGEAVDAVLRAAGHRVRTVRPVLPAGLTEREVDVLRLVARSLSNRGIAQQLSISDRTVQHHVEHVYEKIGVSTRAAATVFAMQYGLLHTPAELSEDAGGATEK